MGRAAAVGVGRPSWAATRTPPASWSSPRCARCSRSAGCCSPARTPHTVVADVRGAAWQEERAALLSRQTSLAQMLIRRGLVLRSDLLSARAHWVTPEFEHRRYDTRFFAALMPEGQVADDLTSEADHADWTDPAQLLRDEAAGRALLLPPTVVCVEEVARASERRRLRRRAGPGAAGRARCRPGWGRTSSSAASCRGERDEPDGPGRLEPRCAGGGSGWSGGAVTARATCVLAPNPGPMTLDGTNTWVLAEPGSQRCVVVDPGPLDERHLAAVLAHVASRGLRVDDHAADPRPRRPRRVGGPVRGADRRPGARARARRGRPRRRRPGHGGRTGAHRRGHARAHRRLPVLPGPGRRHAADR